VTDTRYTVISGEASDAYDLADKLDVFLVDTLGWSRQYTISSGVSIRDRVYYNNGGEVGNPYNDIYARFSASGTILYNYAYTYYSPSGATFSGEMGGDIDTANYGTGSSSGCYYTLIGNKDITWAVIRHLDSGTYYASSVGYCQSYYPAVIDPYPVSIVGQRDNTYGFDQNRIKLYNKDGDEAFYTSSDHSSIVQYGSPQVRYSAYFGMSINISNTVSGQHELRGELLGIKQMYGENFTSGNTVIASGTETVASGEYLVVKHGASNSTTFAYGPYTTGA
jgi:hypothetical protein